MKHVQKYAKQDSEVNGISGGNFHPVFQRVTEEEISFALRVLTTDLGKRQALISQTEIKELTGKGKSTVSNWVNDGAIPAQAFIQIAQAAAKLGDFTLIELLVPSNYSLQPMKGGSPNGDCSDEECEIVGAADRVRQAFDAKDKRAAKRELSSLEKHVASMREEIALL